MRKTVVVMSQGDERSADSIRRLAVTCDVVAVALDLGGAVSLNEMRDQALAAGAVRCHALDVREEFAREALLPALQSGGCTDPGSAVGELASRFAARKLAEIARMEGAAVMAPDTVAVAARALPPAVAAPLHLRVHFADGVPVSVNGVAMTLTELMESLETITGEPALLVLNREMIRARQQPLA
jgi:argininosuccinate synthase